jgi:hypothetical protein
MGSKVLFVLGLFGLALSAANLKHPDAQYLPVDGESVRGGCYSYNPQNKWACVWPVWDHFVTCSEEKCFIPQEATEYSCHHGSAGNYWEGYPNYYWSDECPAASEGYDTCFEYDFRCFDGWLCTNPCDLGNDGNRYCGKDASRTALHTDHMPGSGYCWTNG